MGSPPPSPTTPTTPPRHEQRARLEGPRTPPEAAADPRVMDCADRSGGTPGHARGTDAAGRPEGVGREWVFYVQDPDGGMRRFAVPAGHELHVTLTAAGLVRVNRGGPTVPATPTAPAPVHRPAAAPAPAVPAMDDFKAAMRAVVGEIFAAGRPAPPSAPADPGLTPRDALALARRELEEAAAACAVYGERVPLEEALEGWQAEMKLNGLADPRRQAADVRRIGKVAGWASVRDITHDSILKGMAALAEKNGVKSRRNLLSRLRTFCDYLERSGRLNSNPAKTVKFPRGSHGPGARALTWEEALAVIRAAREQERTDARARCNRRGKGLRSVFYATMLMAGLRPAEVTRLRWDHLDLDAQPPMLTLPGELSKNRRERACVLHPGLAAMLRDAGPTASGKVCDVQPNRWTLIGDFRRAGVPLEVRGRRASLTSFRKTLATTLHDTGLGPAAIATQMRHEDFTITARHYIQTDFRRIYECLGQLPGFEANGSAALLGAGVPG